MINTMNSMRNHSTLQIKSEIIFNQTQCENRAIDIAKQVLFKVHTLLKSRTLHDEEIILKLKTQQNRALCRTN